MAGIKEEQLERMKKIQEADDDDLDLDITQRRRLKTNTCGCAPQDSQDSDKDKAKDTRNLLIVIGGLVLIFAVFVVIFYFLTQVRSVEVPTIDELHQANINGDLDPEQGYVYNGYSFINLGGVWYSQMQKGQALYDVSFNYDPKSVEDISVEGMLSKNFVQGSDIYITFDPHAKSTKYIAVANAGLSLSLVKGFQYNLTAGCTDSDSPTCQNTNVITCEDKDRAVIYFKEDSETKIILEDNCVIIQGYGPEIIRAKDRLLMRWYGIMD